jgi:UDP-3-O-[3-hydroxymyristoyl] glucosamine N-acyltransferase
VIGDDCVIGDHTLLHARVTLYAGCTLGRRGIVHSGAVIGADGFGMAEDEGRWVKIPQVGRVVIGDDCEIGANTTIDRGAIDDTVIEDDVKLDNQIQVGHNCRIGAHTAIAGCVGIAGSANIGRSVRIGGASNIGGHITIADGVVIGGATAVLGIIRERGVYLGAVPWMPQKEWRLVAVEVRRLRMLSSRVAALERALRVQQTGDQEGTTK